MHGSPYARPRLKHNSIALKEISGERGNSGGCSGIEDEMKEERKLVSSKELVMTSSHMQSIKLIIQTNSS